MAKRGMLPKFRPAALGRDASARPSIRPVRPSPPPPPPSPPRRATPAVDRSNLSNVAPFPGVITERDDYSVEMPTATGHAEPATLTRGPETVPFEQAETNRRPRAELQSEPISFEEETQARAVDNGLLDKLRHNTDGMNANVAPVVVAADLGVDYESLPSLEVRRPYDTYEGEFSERDPVTQLHGARGREESASIRRADASRDVSTQREPSYNEPSYPEPAPSYGQQDDVWGRREGSGPRERPMPAAAASYAAPVPAYDDVSVSAQWGRDSVEPAQQSWSSLPARAPENDAHFEEPMIPPAPRLPEEMHPAFVVGVQPIRTATPDAWGTPQAMAPQQGQYVPSPMQAMQSSPPYAQQQQHYTPAPPAHYTPAPQAYYQPPHAQHVHPSAMPSQPAGYLQQSGPHQRDPRYGTPAPMHASGMSPSMMADRMADRMMHRGQPLAAQLDPAPSGGKIGRFAWFVAGAAFGITFAFFATGFFTATAPNNDFPPAPALTAPAAAVAPPVQAAAPVAPPVAVAAPVAPPVAVAAPVAPPVAVAAPVAPPVAAAAPVAPPVAAAALPAAAPTAPPVAVAPPVAAAALPAAAPVAAAPVARPAPPARPRFQAPPPRRPAAPVSQAPKNLGGGGPGADDERAPAPSAPTTPDFGDLLGAGLKP